MTTGKFHFQGIIINNQEKTANIPIKILFGHVVHLTAMLIFVQGDRSYEGQRGSSGLQVSVDFFLTVIPGTLLY